jgi:hypothetical protein
MNKSNKIRSKVLKAIKKRLEEIGFWFIEHNDTQIYLGFLLIYKLK